MTKKYITAGILFFDIHGYSKLDEIQLAAFHECIWPDLIERVVRKAGDFLDKNTWGDGIILLHIDYECLASAALELRDYFRNREYTSIDVLKATDLSTRIALHEGEFLVAQDPFRERPSYFGLEIVKAARIEPVIPPGRVWVTAKVKEAIKRRLQRQNKRSSFSFVLQGDIPLAKAFGVEVVYELIHYGEVPMLDPVKISSSKDLSSDEEQSEPAVELDHKSRPVRKHSRRIFVVHGHDDGLKAELARFLEKLNLVPIILHEQADQGRTIFSKLADEMAEIGYAFVLLTPDDVGARVTAMDSLRHRARQNVIFEHGLFVGYMGSTRVCAIAKGDIEFPSDLHGVIYKRVTPGGNIMSIGLEIVKELQAAGYDIDANLLLPS